MGVFSRIAPIFQFPCILCIFVTANYKHVRIMEMRELQAQLDAETLNFFNYILGKVFDVEVQGHVHSEED